MRCACSLPSEEKAGIDEMGGAATEYPGVVEVGAV